MGIVSILGFGAIGLGFLLAYLAYRLLAKDPTRERPIYVYMAFCLVLVGVGAALQFDESRNRAMKQTEAITHAAAILSKVQATVAEQGKYAVEDSCKGGPHGIATNHSGDITRLNTLISTDLAEASGIISSAAKISAPHLLK
jgi:hypothetical protein